MGKPDISVLVVSHNHERYLEYALASIENQVTESTVEVVVADDDSTDSTLRIAHDWKRQSKFDVRILEPEPRLGISRNYRRGFAACSGRYIAVLEGDDEWLTSDKLDRQAAYLDANNDVTVAANRLLIFSESTGSAGLWPIVGTGSDAVRVEGDQLADLNWFGTFSACMFRAEALRRIPTKVFDEVSYDWMVNLAILEFGPGALLGNVGTLYRSHSLGAWSGRSQYERDTVLQQLLPTYMELLEGRLSRQLGRALVTVERRLAEEPAPQSTLKSKPDAPTKPAQPRLPLPRTTSADSPRVSVVTVADGDHSIEAIRSVLAQSVPDVEVIIVHPDGSTVASRPWKQLADSRIRHYPLTHSPGEAGALNLGIHQARGDFIAIIDPRDAWESSKLARQLERFENTPELGAVFTGARLVGENGRPLPSDRLPSWRDVYRQPNRSQGQWLRHFMSNGNPLCHSSVLIRREVFFEIGLYDPTLVHLLDFDRWVALVKRFPIDVLGDEPLVRVRTTRGDRGDDNPHPELYHENIVINQRMFDGVTPQQLAEGFSDVLRSAFPSTPLEIDCATALLWLDCTGRRQHLNYAQALADLRRVFRDPDGELHLVTSYELAPEFMHELARRVEGAQTVTALNSMRQLRLTPERQPAPPSLAGKISGTVATLRAIPLREWPRQITRRLRAAR